MERPWHRHYDPGVPATLDYPRVPLYRLLDESAARAPRRAATSFFGKSLSYGALKEQSDRLADALRGLGVAAGDRVALLLPNCPPFVIAYYGALKAGAVVVALNPLASADELAVQLADCGAETLVTIPLFAATAAGLRERTPVRRLILARLADHLPLPLSLAMGLREARQLGGLPSPRPLELRALLASPPGKGFAPSQSDPGSLAVLLYSGGTTGAAKGIMLSHAACVANAHQIRAWGHLQPDDRILAVLPLFHGYGMSVNMNAALLAGGEIVLLPRFNAREVLKTIQRRRPTFFTGVPTMFVAFSNLPELERYRLDSLKGIFVGAAPLTLAIKEAFEARTGGRMIEGYGLTEVVTAIMANPYRGQHKLGSVGVPFPDVEVRVVSLEDGRELPPGEQGEVVLRSPTMMLGYYNRPEATAEAIRDGWLYTGDIGSLDEDGYLSLIDRKKDLIIVGGFNVFPREVEEALFQHPKVREGVVVGVPDDYAGERVKAFVVLREGETATSEEIIAFLRERLTRYKVPSEVEFRAELPKSMIGKVLRRALREETAAQTRAVAE
ncbi:MAG TPA: long-chain fatty acid--CoA ligase [Chloroflexaceae bacterium]|nr:long-chain fatty acid--CoA ligase [Chloroflexaceae bacterium]